MTLPSQQAYQKALECVRDIYSHTDLESLRSHLIAVLPKLIASSLTYYAATEPKTQSTYELVDQSKGSRIEKLQPAFEEHMNEAPIIRRSLGKLPGQVMKISDYLSQRQFHQTGLYHEYYKPLGLEDAMVITLPSPPTVVSTLVLSRDNRSFNEKDRIILQTLAPHIVQACLNAEKMDQQLATEKKRGRILEALQQGAILVSNTGTVHYITQRATDWLKKFFLEERLLSKQLPEPIYHWFISQRDKLLQKTGKLSIFQWEANGQCLWIYLGEALVEKDFILLLEEKSLSHESLQSLGLSPREAEILFWMAQGKTNPEIATILKANSSTVKKHVEHILSKLGVENRSAASIKAMEVIGLPQT